MTNSKTYGLINFVADDEFTELDELCSQTCLGECAIGGPQPVLCEKSHGHRNRFCPCSARSFLGGWPWVDHPSGSELISQ